MSWKVKKQSRKGGQALEQAQQGNGGINIPEGLKQQTNIVLKDKFQGWIWQCWINIWIHWA